MVNISDLKKWIREVLKPLHKGSNWNAMSNADFNQTMDQLEAYWSTEEATMFAAITNTNGSAISINRKRELFLYLLIFRTERILGNRT